MDNTTSTFEEWFEFLQSRVLDETNIQFRDKDSVRTDYSEGRDVEDVAIDIIAEYQADE